MNFSMRSGGWIAVLAFASLLVGLAPPAGAFQPMPQNESLEIRLPEFDIEGYQSPAKMAATLSGARTLSARYGGNWQIYSWNAQTGAARWAYGTSPKVSDAIDDATQAEVVARRVISANQDLLRADASQLRLTAVEHALGKWGVHFQQTWNGIDVHGAVVRVILTDDGRMMLMGSDYQPNISLSPVTGVSREQAIEIARLSVPFNATTDRVEDGTSLLVLPVPVSASEVSHHLVWKVRVRTENPLGIWVTHVDAHTGEILWRYNDISFAYLGTTETEVQRFGWCDGSTNMTIPYLRIQVNGIGNVNTDANGNWSINGTGGPRQVTADLYGPFVDMNNFAGAEATFTGTAQENVPLNVTFFDSNAQQDERDTFDAVNDVHDFFELFDPGFSYTQQRISAYVSRNDFYCPGNAWWDGTINFCAAGGQYANTGELQQVVHHEFGHGVSQTVIGGQGTQGIGEGNSDILGNLITQDPIIGRGFYTGNCVSGIRNSLNHLMYPDDVVGQEIHTAGQVIAGFNWDSMVLLQGLYGTDQGTIESATRWHFGRVLMHPQTQPDQVLATFVADDDNGNLDDGTPHHAIFCEAAQNHGFECPEILVGVFVNSDDHPYTAEQTGYDVVATAVSLPLGQGEIVDSSVQVHYRVNGGDFATAPMVPTGNPDEYEGTIPGAAWGSIVEYYISASDNLGAYGTSPRNAPDELHYFQVDDAFPDEMETATAWHAGAEGDDAASGRWERVDPIGTTYNGQPCQPENDHTTDPGHICWITGNGQVGGAAGEADVDAGKTTVLSPNFDLTHASQIQVSYWKYYTNNLGNSPDLDYWDVDVTNDGGQSWTPIEHTTTSTNAWAPMSFDLADYVADPGIVQFRFVASDVSPGSLVEAGLDDFLLTAVWDLAATEDFQVRFVTGLAPSTPNPFGLRTDIRFRLGNPSEVDLAVYDASGRRVANLASGRLAAGEHLAHWDGQNDAGHRVPAGVYFCRLQADGKTYNARMVLLK
ncbi:MAG: FlgD immunoglobulin-like domain containing protein [Candidatus Eisenbacteria bacterium]